MPAATPASDGLRWSADGPFGRHSLGRQLTHNAVWLGKKSRLSGRILRVAKVAEADANQAKPLVRAEANTF